MKRTLTTPWWLLSLFLAVIWFAPNRISGSPPDRRLDRDQPATDEG